MVNKTRPYSAQHRDLLQAPLTALLKHCQQFAYELPAKHITETVMAIAQDSISSQPVLESTLAKTVDVISTKLHTFSFEQAASVAWSFGKCSRPDKKDILDRLENFLYKQLEEAADSHKAALILWAFTRYH
jgi:hypothetical protein